MSGFYEGYDRLRTHARTIVEGEGAETEDTALVEAVAIALWGDEPTWWDLPNDKRERREARYESTRDDFRDDARTALEAIRKHQAGE